MYINIFKNIYVYIKIYIHVHICTNILGSKTHSCAQSCGCGVIWTPTRCASLFFSIVWFLDQFDRFIPHRGLDGPEKSLGYTGNRVDGP